MSKNELEKISLYQNMNPSEYAAEILEQEEKLIQDLKKAEESEIYKWAQMLRSVFVDIRLVESPIMWSGKRDLTRSEDLHIAFQVDLYRSSKEEPK